MAPTPIDLVARAIAMMLRDRDRVIAQLTGPRDVTYADVGRFLDAQPVLAHRETWSERAGRISRTYQTAILLVLAYLTMRLLFLATRGF